MRGREREKAQYTGGEKGDCADSVLQTKIKTYFLCYRALRREGILVDIVT